MRSYFSRHPSFNLINLHIVLLEAAVLIGGLFLLAYLLQAGFSVSVALTVTASTFLLRISLRGVSSAIIRRFGLRKSMMIGSVLYVVRFALLPFVSGVDFWLLAFVVAESAAAAVYWMSYHLYFAHLSNHSDRGSQVAGQAVARIAAGTLAPLLGGFLLAHFHPDVSVVVCALLIAVGTWVLGRMPRITLPQPSADSLDSTEKPRRALLLSTGHSLLEAGTVWLWPLIIFFGTGENFQLTGIILAILPLGMAALSHLVGDRIDR
jgi:MFS family permease